MEPKYIANATFNQVANATVAPATVLLMNEQNIQAWRAQRLAAMVEREGGKAAARNRARSRCQPHQALPRAYRTRGCGSDGAAGLSAPQRLLFARHQARVRRSASQPLQARPTMRGIR